MSGIRVVLVDDHPPVRDGVKVALQRDKDIIISGEAETAEELSEILRDSDIDVVILDISLPDGSGVELVTQLREQYPLLKIIILSMYSRSDYVLEAVSNGVNGYMTKETSPVRLIDGIKQVLRGEYFFDQVTLEVIIQKALEHPQRFYDVQDNDYESLTSREQEIMRLLAEGLSVKRIAQSLYISYRTVENHRTSIFRKLKVKNAAELVHYATRLGIIDL
ncbi:MAG: response regulator transcription factor [Spirochaetaceae bacterium]|nr:response regulator transcription factor [Spirochaetaceae bacterium]MCF7948505.1 response regulator transcription factor [Spirochaetia bacterium]MCF7951433.1 response regulator transcription factor [Spirochaetaceae bacterium]